MESFNSTKRQNHILYKQFNSNNLIGIDIANDITFDIGYPAATTYSASVDMIQAFNKVFIFKGGSTALENNLKIIKSKKIQISKDEASEFYKVHQSKPFYDKLCNYLSSGPIEAIVLEGENAISKNRELMGATNPKDAEDGTIRKMYGISIDKNSVHGSDSLENAKIEINFFNYKR